MGFATSQQLTKYYDLYRDTEVVFTKEVIRTVNLDPRQIYIKYTGAQWPCILNSCSLMAAKIIIGTKSGAYETLSTDSGSVNLRFCFKNPEESAPISFFVTCRVADIKPYNNSDEYAIVTLNFTQRPPDDLIEILGKLLEANINAVKRREERIILAPDSMRRLGIASKETVVYIQNVPRHCIIRDLSFSGAKIILLGLPQFLLKKEAVLRIDFNEPREVIGLRGIIANTETIEGRKDLTAAAVLFSENNVPMSYKMHINNYLSQIRKKQLTTNVANTEFARQQRPDSVVHTSVPDPFAEK